MSDFIFLGSKITADGDCSHEIKRCLLMGRKVMTNLDSIFKSRDIILPTKVHLVKAMVFPVVIYGCESWTVKKAERQRIDAFELWCWRRLSRVPWTARKSNQSILNEISPGCSLEGLMLKLKLQYFGYLKRRVDSLEKTLTLGGTGGRRRRGRQRMRWLDGITDSEWTPGVGDGQGGLACCDSWGRKELDMTERLNWTKRASFVQLMVIFWDSDDGNLYLPETFSVSDQIQEEERLYIDCWILCYLDSIRRRHGQVLWGKQAESSGVTNTKLHRTLSGKSKTKPPDLLSFSLKCLFTFPPLNLVPCFCESWLPLLALARLRWRRTGEILLIA